MTEPPDAALGGDAVPANTAPPPATGHAEIDAALGRLELGPDVHEHPDRIAAALDAVSRALQAEPRPTQAR
ncbi:hypothetical protein [Propioniciclava soli]|uniref:Uncharacterized protein n=1 Tax=Propioniciclava soli TaxID=2775081 RepID=A0ABZ3CAH5_9ACTN|nr:hypothetical protein [Propioniciclava soli]